MRWSAFITVLTLAAWAAALPAQVQRVFTEPEIFDPVANARVTFDVVYTSSDSFDENLTGLGLRIHWDSSKIEMVLLSEVLLDGFLQQGLPEADSADLDGDSATDRSLLIAWADPDGTWPGFGSLPEILFRATFDSLPGFSGETRVRFSSTSTAAGYGFAPIPAVVMEETLFADGFETGDLTAWSAATLTAALGRESGAFTLGSIDVGGLLAEGLLIHQRLIALGGTPPVVAPMALDVDGDTVTDEATDGILILRYLFGFRGELLIAGVVAPGATRTSAEGIEDFLDSIREVIDIDLDGRLNALTDGILILRFLSGLQGDLLVDGAVDPGGARTVPDDILLFLNVLSDPNGDGDSDLDGLSDLAEVVGYDILIDFLGLGVGDPNFPDSLVERRVTSDPFRANSDSDSLIDFEERLFRTDPANPDTDEDGLDDDVELTLYGSTPVSVDSDADARGPDHDLIPNPLFFDGNELSLFGSSPALADTDGDASSDFTEANQNGEDPLVANVPRVAVELVGGIDLQLDLTLSDGVSTTTSETTTLAQSQTTGSSRTDSETSQWSIGASATVTAGVSAGFPGGATASAEVSATVSGEYSEEDTTTFTEDSSRTAQEEFQTLREDNVTMERTVSGGSIGTGLRIRNTGDVAFTLSNLVLTALIRDPEVRDEFRAIASLTPQFPSGGVTLGPFNGQTGVLLVGTRSGDGSGTSNVSAPLIESLLADPSGLFLDVATFDLVDENGRNFAFLADVTNARTALVTLDFGNGTVERFRVATLVERNPDGTSAGVTMEKIITDILEIPFETAERSGSTDPVLFPDGVSVLTRVRDIETEVVDPLVDPDAFVNSFWAVLSTDPELTGASGEAFSTDFEDILLESGDRISLAYVSDGDRDGLFAREEFLYGTVDRPFDFNFDTVIDQEEKDRSTDFDLDDLDDFFEVRTGWEVEIDMLSVRRVFSDPTRADGDDDGVLDHDEFLGRDGVAAVAEGDSGDATDPLSRDTDQDGLRDGVDDDPVSSFNVPPVISPFAISQNFSAVTVTGSATDPIDGIERLVIDWGDGTADTLTNPGPPFPSPFDFDRTHNYLGVGTFGIEVIATDGRQPPGTPAESLPATGSVTVDFPIDEVASYFFDGDFTDSSGNGHDGSQSSEPVQFTADRFERASTAVCVDDSNVLNPDCEFVDLPTGLALGSRLSLAVWLIPGDMGGVDDNFKRSMIVGDPDFARLVLVDDKVRFELLDGTDVTMVEDPTAPPRVDVNGEADCNPATPPAIGTWRFYAVTVDHNGTDTTLKLYRGDKPAADVAETVTLVNGPGGTPVLGTVFTNPAAGRLIVGGTSDGCDAGDIPYVGRIDDVRVYDRALTETEINALLNEGP